MSDADMYRACLAADNAYQRLRKNAAYRWATLKNIIVSSAVLLGAFIQTLPAVAQSSGDISLLCFSDICIGESVASLTKLKLDGPAPSASPQAALPKAAKVPAAWEPWVADLGGIWHGGPQDTKMKFSFSPKRMVIEEIGSGSMGAVPVEVVGIDSANEAITINVPPTNALRALAEFNTAGAAQEWTIRRVWNKAHTEFNALIVFPGATWRMGFVRRLFPAEVADMENPPAQAARKSAKTLSDLSDGQRISRILGLSPEQAGSTVLAPANPAPDILVNTANQTALAAMKPQCEVVANDLLATYRSEGGYTTEVRFSQAVSGGQAIYVVSRIVREYDFSEGSAEQVAAEKAIAEQFKCGNRFLRCFYGDRNVADIHVDRGSLKGNFNHMLFTMELTPNQEQWKPGGAWFQNASYCPKKAAPSLN